MYANYSPRRGHTGSRLAALAVAVVAWSAPSWAAAQQAATPLLAPSVVRNIQRSNERLEMTVNSSQIVTLGTRIPRLVVNNPELVTVTPMSETEIQIAARKPGVTQINLWDENGQVYTIDLLIFGDVRELEMVLKQMFPTSTIRVTRLTNSLVINGQVDRPEVVSTVFRLAEDYAPKVVSNLSVGGVQQVLLKVKVMEVSRTKLRAMGVDFAIGNDGAGNPAFVSGISQLLDKPTGSLDGPTFAVFGRDMTVLVEALQQRRVAKTLADPTLVTVSGRAARFQVGGQIPVPVPQPGAGGQGAAIGIEYKDYGTVVDFVPIVLGNGRIRLEVKPDLTDLDYLNAVSIQGTLVPGLKRHTVDTGVEMMAGQTLAISGLIQEKVVAQHRGLPYISDIPVLGVPFRRVQEQTDEIESLVLVTPNYADALDPHEVPQCGPGMETMSPTDCQLYWKGHIEVPSCGPCGASEPCTCNAPGLRCENGQCGPGGIGPGYAGAPMGPPAMATDGGFYGHPMGAPYGGEPIEPTPAGGPWGEPTGPLVEPATPDAARDPSARRLPQGAHRGHAPVAARPTSTPGLIGPIGYDVHK